MPSDPSWVSEVARIFQEAGVPPVVWVTLLLHESNGNPNAVNDTRGRDDLRPGTVEEYSVGLFQINVHARGLPPDEEEALAEFLKDPIENAKVAAAKLGPVWAAVGPLLTTEAAPEDWPWAIGIRSGWPGGSVEYPCLTEYCKSIAPGFRTVAARWLAAIQQSETGEILAPYWTYNGPVPEPPIPGDPDPDDVATALGSSQRSGGKPETRNPAGYSQGTPGSGNNTVGQIGTAIQTWWKDNGARVVVFLMGLALVGIAVTAILFEQTGKGARELGAAIVNPAAAANAPSE